MYPVADGLELGRLVDDVFGGGDLAAVVQPARDVQLVPAGLVQREIPEGAVGHLARSPRQHLGEHRHALAMAAGVRGFRINGRCDQLDERVEQPLLRFDQHVVVDGHRGLRSQRFDQRHDGRVERYDLACSVFGIDELHHADHHAFMIFKRHRQEGLGVITGRGVEAHGAGKIELVLVRVGVLNIDGLPGDGAARCDIVHVGRAGRSEELNRLERDLSPAGAAECDVERVIANDLKSELFVLIIQIERSGVRIGERLRFEQDPLHQLCVVALHG